MAYYLTGFGGVTFPIIQPITEMPTVAGINGALNTLGGGYDAWGADQAPAQFPYTLQYRVTASSQTAATYMTTVNGIRALGRTRGTLTRKDQAGTTHTCLARCLDIAATDSVETFNAIEIALTFEVWSHWTKNPVSTPVSIIQSPQAITVINGGNVTVTDAIITITAGADTPLTAVTVALGSALWTWAGTLAVGKSLVIDCGAWSVLNDGADAYAGLVLAAGHTLVGWLAIAPGTSYLTLTTTGGAGVGKAITVAFSEAWA